MPTKIPTLMAMPKMTALRRGLIQLLVVLGLFEWYSPSPSSWAATDLVHQFLVMSPRAHPYETVVQFQYFVNCRDNNEDQVRGYLSFQGRRVVLNFYKYRNKLEVSLGSAPLSPQLAVLELLPSTSCDLKKIESQVKYEDVGIYGNEQPRQLVKKLALLYSPFLNYRENQYQGPPNDVAILLAYSVHPAPDNHRILRYTMYFSDEDNQNSSALTNAQLARYGRTTDIEWVYEIKFDENLNVVNERFQGALHFGFPFRGSYLPSETGRTHPILYNYNLGDNNVFMDTAFSWLSVIPNPLQRSQPTGHHLVPRYRIDYPQARESVMFSEPWMFQVSENELKRQQKPAVPIQDQLFVQIQGHLYAGRFWGKLTPFKGASVLSGGMPCALSSCNVNELGTDLWNRESFTVVPLGAGPLNQLTFEKSFHGQFCLLGTKALDLAVKSLRFFRLKMTNTLEVEDLSDCFKCRLGRLNEEALCRF
jgi:hypothetical protein